MSPRRKVVNPRGPNRSRRGDDYITVVKNHYGQLNDSGERLARRIRIPSMARRANGIVTPGPVALKLDPAARRITIAADPNGAYWVDVANLVNSTDIYFFPLGVYRSVGGGAYELDATATAITKN